MRLGLTPVFTLEFCQGSDWAEWRTGSFRCGEANAIRFGEAQGSFQPKPLRSCFYGFLPRAVEAWSGLLGFWVSEKPTGLLTSLGAQD